MPAALSLRHRQVFLTGHIDDASARLVIAQLLYLEEASPTEPIQLHINSSGGKVHAGIAIHDVMQSLRAPVYTTCLGHCESMAAVILAAGEKGERAAMPNARVMIHQPTRAHLVVEEFEQIARDSGGGAGAQPPQAGRAAGGGDGQAARGD